jgi:hypothetical protein
MATTVESVDNLPKPPPQERVNPTERSSTNQQRRQFKRALKEEMEQNEDKTKKKDHQQVDAVMIEQDQKDREPDPGTQETDGLKQGAEKAVSKKKEEPSGEEHIDLKA